MSKDIPLVLPAHPHLLQSEQGEQNSLNNVLAFLSDSFVAGKCYQTLNTYRSMLSAALLPIDGQKVGKHPAALELMRGIFNSNSPQKYSTTWDVNLVVTHFGSMPENSCLPLIQLARKTAI
jgi:hypothetical protein